MNKKGLLNQIYIVLILIVVIIAIIGTFSLASIVLPIIVGEGSHVTNVIKTDLVNSNVNELQNATQVTSTAVNNVLGNIELLVYVFFLGLIIGFIFIAYYSRTYPFLAWFWTVGMFILVIIAMIMSNAYEEAKNSSELQAFYLMWGTNDLLMSYLPHIIATIGILGGIILFVLISRDSEAEVQTL